MIKLAKLLLSFVLGVTFILGVNSSVFAQEGTTNSGFYVDNILKSPLSEFVLSSKNKKKQVIKEMIKAGNKGVIVMPNNIVYNFSDLMIYSESELKKKGVTLEIYIKENGPLKAYDDKKEFYITSIK